MSKSFRVTVVNAGVGDPSSTQLLLDRAASRVGEFARNRDLEVAIGVVSLRELASEISAAIVSRHLGQKLSTAVEALGSSDGLIVGTPVYKAGVSGLFKSFFDVLDNDLLIAKPVMLAATAGTARHALVIDDQMRQLFAYMRSLVVPTSLFASTEDWNDAGLNERIDRAAVEFVLLMQSGFANEIRDESWKRYQHEFGSAGTSVDFDSDLMRLAAGGKWARGKQ